MTQLQAILFDVDGTIAMNAEDIHKNCVAQTLAETHLAKQIPFDNDAFERIWKSQLGGGIKPFFKVYLNSYPDIRSGEDPDIQAGGLEQQYLLNYLHSTEAVICRDGIDKLLELKEKLGIKIAAVSNATQEVLEHTLERALSASGHTLEDFDVVIGQDTVKAAGFKVKPFGGSYRYACELMNVDPQKCWGFEDSMNGYVSLVDAGIGTTIWCETSNYDSFDEQAKKFKENLTNAFNRTNIDFEILQPQAKAPQGVGHFAQMILDASNAALEHYTQEQLGVNQSNAAHASDKRITHAPNFL